jgi:hypothetical protein
LPQRETIQRKDDVHFTATGYKVLAEQVVKSLPDLAKAKESQARRRAETSRNRGDSAKESVHVTKRDIIRAVLEGKRPPYVPWACAFTDGARQKVCEHYGNDDLHAAVDNHVLFLNHVLTRGAVAYFEELEGHRVRDPFGVVWNRRESKAVGIVEGCVLAEPTLANYRFPDPRGSAVFPVHTFVAATAIGLFFGFLRLPQPFRARRVAEGAEKPDDRFL